MYFVFTSQTEGVVFIFYFQLIDTDYNFVPLGHTHEDIDQLFFKELVKKLAHAELLQVVMRSSLNLSSLME